MNKSFVVNLATDNFNEENASAVINGTVFKEEHEGVVALGVELTLDELAKYFKEYLESDRPIEIQSSDIFVNKNYIVIPFGTSK